LHFQHALGDTCSFSASAISALKRLGIHGFSLQRFGFASLRLCVKMFSFMAALPLLQPDTLIVRSPEQISGELDGRVVLLSIENGEYYDMNKAGSRIWTLLEKPMAVTALIDRLLTEFEVDRVICEKDVRELLEKLLADKLVRIVPPGA